jgi:CubicO group peptidase (beta-lactamase class C family)
MIQDGQVKLSTLAKNIDKRIGDNYPGVTIRHFVTMTSGYDGKHQSNFEPAYECDSAGIICDTWDPGVPLKPLFSPGKKFRYWDEAEMELSYCLGLIGRNPDFVRDLLKKRIADPIGMENFEWREIQTTVGLLPAMNGGLKTNAQDLARYGLLFLNKGNWNGKQLIAKKWVNEATTVQVPVSIPNDVTPRAKGSGAYGYNWWINGIIPKGTRYLPDATPQTYWASGFGTNRCFIVPEWNMVIVRTGEKPAGWTDADAVFNSFLKLIGQAITKD